MFLLVGAVWGILASVFYISVINSVPMPVGIVLGFSVFLPGLIGKVLVYNGFGFLTLAHREILSAVVSMFVGMAIFYVLWLLWKKI
jgi:hypothetical protein